MKAKYHRRKPHVKVYKDRKGEYRWRYRAANGKIMVASTEGYKTRAGVELALGNFIIGLLGLLGEIKPNYASNN